MNLKSFLPILLSVSTSAIVLSGCSDFDNGFDGKSVLYEQNFREAFKEIDPNGTWNATRSGSVDVSVTETSQVMVYAKGLSTNLQLRCDVVNAGETKKIVYNAPKGVDEVYVIAKNFNNWGSKTIEVGNDKKVSFSSLQTRALPATYNYGVAHPISYVSNAYSIDNQPNVFASPGGVKEYYNSYGDGAYNMSLIASTGSTSYPYPTWGNLYAAYPWEYTSPKTTPTKEHLSTDQFPKPFAIEHDDVTLSTAIKDAIRNVVGTADDRQEILQPYTQDIDYMTTVEPGQIEITLVSTQTNNSNVIGYYYTIGNQTTEQLKSVKKFVLIPCMGQQVAGDKFKLVYFGPNYDQEGTYDFPKGVKIHFFLSRKTQGDSNQTNFNLEERIVHHGVQDGDFLNTTYTDFYGMYTDVTFFSDSELNDVAQQSFSSFTFPATAAFNVMGQNCISFEDYPNAGSIDWNDAVFTIDAPFQDFSSFDEVQSFIIAVEDLGNTYDFDYNDCVVRVQQSTTTLKYEGGTTDTRVNPATVTLLASGGTLPIKVEYDGETLISETHAAFGVDTKVPVNVNANGGASKAPVTVVWTNAPENLNMTVAAPKFNFIVEDGDNTTVNVPTATEGENSVPVAFIIPDAQTWTWPDEGVNITSVYNDFETWVANNNDATAEYWYNYQWGKTYSTSDPSGEGGGEGGGGNTPETMELNQSYTLLSTETASKAASSDWTSIWVNYILEIDMSNYSIPASAEQMTVTFTGNFSANMGIYNGSKESLASGQQQTRTFTIEKGKLNSISGKSFVIGSYNEFNVESVSVEIQ